jgi:hypothetical protein
MDWGFISQKTTFFIVTAVKTSDLTKIDVVLKMGEGSDIHMNEVGINFSTPP